MRIIMNLKWLELFISNKIISILIYIYFSFQLQENQDEIENMMNSIFKGIFVHRYR